MPSSPRTPRHSRHSSAMSVSSPGHNDFRVRRDSQTSQSSMQFPTTPQRHSFVRSNSIGNDAFSPAGASNGLGNLADELADAWDEDEEEEVDMNFQEAEKFEEPRDSGVDIQMSPTRQQENLIPPKQTNGHRRKGSEYDGSDYGEDSDPEDPGVLPSGLIARMDQVENLARRGLDNFGSESDGVVKRVVDSLRDLGSQAKVEGGATRLSTAHSALSTHLDHQTRLLRSLSQPFYPPITLQLDEEFIDELLELLATASSSLPRPNTSSLNALTQLHSSTTDLIQIINSLSDTLHMSRQTTNLATRRLKSARELVTELRREDEEREQAERWLEKGTWNERLQRRECSTVCRDVVGGFEKVCDGWRERLLAQADAIGIAS